MSTTFNIVATKNATEIDETIRILILRALVHLKTRVNLSPLEHVYKKNNDDDYDDVNEILSFLFKNKTDEDIYSFVNRSNIENAGTSGYLSESIKKEENGNAYQHRSYSVLLGYHQFAEDYAKEAQFRIPFILANNLKKLSKLIGLNDVECKLLALVVMTKTNRYLRKTMGAIKGLTTSLDVYHNLSIFLKIDESQIRLALASQSILAKTSILQVKIPIYRSNHSMDEALEILSNFFADCILCEDSSPIEWLRDMVTISAVPHLNLQDFSHLQTNIDFLLPYLKKVLMENQSGVNVFFYGMPGTGKTQIARLLAQALDCTLYEIVCENSDGNPINGEQRLSALQAAQYFFKRGRALLLFDEIEDVFFNANNHWGHQGIAQRRKAWINRLLEENCTPIFWLGNQINSVDPAYIRRFDWIMEFAVPPRRKREQIIRDCAQGILPEKMIRQLAACEQLAPAVVTRAAKVMGALRDQFSDALLSWAMQDLINKTLIAQGHSNGIYFEDSLALPDYYNLDLLNCDADLKTLAQGIAEQGSARLCFYGPPGTGKSAYSRWLANMLEKPLHIKRCSEILSMWVGRSEKNIAKIFREAEMDDAVLLIDEVDSFLFDRRSSNHSWEMSCVNEMLTQIESFRGIFIATTNRMEFLDAASIRRFDMKIKFSPLTISQSNQLLKEHCQLLGLPAPTVLHQQTLQRLDNLTPGDFAVLTRQSRFRPLKDVDAQPFQGVFCGGISHPPQAIIFNVCKIIGTQKFEPFH